nr:pyruvate kinase [Actinomycetota bacterium]
MRERPRATKLVCTLGPATDGRIPELVEAGMDVARLNLSHGPVTDHEIRLGEVRAAMRDAGRTVGVLADLSGPKVRLGEVEGGEIRLEAGTQFVLRDTSHAGLAADLQRGDRVLLSDGAVELRVISSEDVAVTEVVRGGYIRNRAGVNVPAERLSLPALTPKDHQDAAWALEAGADMVAQSFVRSAEDVRQLRKLLGDQPPLVVAKIETRSAVEDVEAIMRESDAVMVARGDLGVEMDQEEIPVIQRELVDLAMRMEVPVIVATQMLDSMIKFPRPTRAEVSDAAGAVFMGADAVMLSAETAIGSFPIEAARTATRILEISERSRFLPPPPDALAASEEAHLIARAAAAVSRRQSVRAIACFTGTGRTATLLAATRPAVPIYAFSPNARVVSMLTLYRGVHPFLSEEPEDTDAMVDLMDAMLQRAGLS